MADHKKVSKGLKPLARWQALLVPPVLLIVAWNTYARDCLYRLFLSRRVYEKFVFVPREIPKKASADKDSSPQGLAS